METPIATYAARHNTHGIQGVPFFVVDGRYGISGAQKMLAPASTVCARFLTTGSNPDYGE